VIVIAAAGLVVFAMRETADLFYTPERLAEDGLPEAGRRVKIGGFVEPGSLEYGADALIRFTVVDDSPNTLLVSYRGVAPDLFREGSGVVATGSFDMEGHFEATQLLAKHDENYVPRELKHIEQPGT
jgi:cytochrome c-type biogenesis protein CcmE